MAKISFKYKYRDDYNPTYVNGAYGGITVKSEIVANFFLERHCLPKKEILQIDEKEVTSTIEYDPKDLQQSRLRFVECGVVMNVQTAKEIVEWLKDKISLIENINSKPEKEEKNAKKKAVPKK